MGRRCAVKVLVPDVAADPRNTTRFEREARLTSQLAHPHTVVIYDFGFDAERQLLFLAMEYIEGESLRDRIGRESRLELDAAVRIAHQAARSLDDAPCRGLVHRDVKPHNIMLTRRAGELDFVKVIDFGIAKFFDAESVRQTLTRVTATGSVVGTPAYMSPEQVRNEDLDGRTDQYSLAVCLYQMLAGRTVFVASSPLDLATKHVIEPPLPLSVLRRDAEIPVGFDDVLLRALSKEPDDRYPTIRAFADSLVEAAGVSLSPAVETGEERRSATGDEELALSDTASLDAPVEPHASSTDGSDSDADPMTAKTPVVAARPSDDVPGHTVRVEPNGGAGTSEWAFTGAAPQEPPRRAARSVRVTAALAVMAVVAVVAALAARDSRSVTSSTSTPAPAVTRAPTAAGAANGPLRLKATERGDDEITEAIDDVPRRTPEPAMDLAPEEVERAQKPGKGRASDERAREARFPAAGEEVTARPHERTIEPDPPDVDDAPATGTVNVTLLPWGELWVDGVRRGDRGRQRLILEAGEHRFELRQDGEVRARKTVDVRRGENTMIELIAR